MKLLLDENLSRHLCSRLDQLYPGTKHVEDVGLGGASDTEVWDYAGKNGFAIVSKDSDFHQRSFTLGAPPKVIWLRIGNCTTAQIEKLLRDKVIKVLAFDADTGASFLVLDP